MNTLRLRAPSRLHFGLLARGPHAPRQFGGLGLMIDSPGLVIEAEPSHHWLADGPLADRALGVAEQVASRLTEMGLEPVPLALSIRQAPAEHVGLGTGTQLGLSVAKLVAIAAGCSDLEAPKLAALAGRGERSGVGLHGFDVGGLVVEGGHLKNGGIAPLLCRMEFPKDWSALIVIPPSPEGLHGYEERQAFAALPPMPDAETDRLCRLVLLGVLPAVAERDMSGFSAALEEIQHRVGSWFAPAQGGVFASRRAEEMVSWLRSQGLKGVGQSSWGPTIYGFTNEGPEWQVRMLKSLRERFQLGNAGLWTGASEGCVIETR
jgi:beta-ribofuranosylaminobenzene 5'-phosphate synthase